MFDCVIVNYNTTLLTNACIQSLRNSNTNCNIWVFDNSDTEPLTLYHNNINVLDNTKGQIINFEEFLNQYPQRRSIDGRWGTAMHTKTIDTLFDLFPKGFIHLDSDTIVKRNLDEVFNPKYAACGKYIPAADIPNKPSRKFARLHPYLLYINVPMCMEHNIRFFDAGRNIGLTRTPKMDTGASLLQDIKKNKLPYKKLNAEVYVSHLAGAWRKTGDNVMKFINDNMKYIDGLDEEVIDNFDK